MKKHIKPSKFLQQALVVFGLFMMFPTSSTSQNTIGQLNDRIIAIDNEIKRLTYKREAIGLEFEAISNFSMNVRPILAGYTDIAESIRLKQSEKSSYYLYDEKRRQLNDELIALENQREKYFSQFIKSINQFKNNNGVVGDFGGNINTIEDLQNEWQKTVNYYQDQKKEYDNLALKLENLNNEKIDLVAEMESMGYNKKEYDDLLLNATYPYGDEADQVAEMESMGYNKNLGREQSLTGCWNLRTGKYISTITVVQVSDLVYQGTLTVNNLEGYYTNQKMFSVSRTSNDSFRGTEYIWSKPDKNGLQHSIEISMKITINSDGNFLIWTSDETVTMQRCN